MNDLVAFSHDHRSLTIAGIAIWVGVSLSMVFTLWIRHSTVPPIWRVFWSLVLAIPVLGWIAYLGLFRLSARDRAGITAPPRWSY